MSLAMMARQIQQDPWETSPAPNERAPGPFARYPAYQHPFAPSDTSMPANLYRNDVGSAERRLKDRFDIVPTDFEGERRPNQVTQAEYEEMCMYFGHHQPDGSRSNLGWFSPNVDRSQLLENDIASILQTPEGRDLVRQLSTAKGADGTARRTQIENVPVPGYAQTGPLSGPHSVDQPKYSNNGPLAAAKEKVSHPNMYDGVGTNMYVAHVAGQDATDAQQQPMRSDIKLYRELLFALHGVRGDMPQGGEELAALSAQISASVAGYGATSGLLRPREGAAGTPLELFKQYER